MCEIRNEINLKFKEKTGLLLGRPVIFSPSIWKRASQTWREAALNGGWFIWNQLRPVRESFPVMRRMITGIGHVPIRVLYSTYEWLESLWRKTSRIWNLESIQARFPQLETVPLSPPRILLSVSLFRSGYSAQVPSPIQSGIKKRAEWNSSVALMPLYVNRMSCRFVFRPLPATTCMT